MLPDTQISKMVWVALGEQGPDLVQQLFNLLELLVRQSPRVNTSDLPSKVFKFGWICRGWERNREEFNGHYTFVDNDELSRRSDTEPHFFPRAAQAFCFSTGPTSP